MRLLLMMLLAAGCGSFEWRLTTVPSQSDWTREFGAPERLVTDGAVLYVAAQKGLYAMKGAEKLWALPLPEERRALSLGEGKLVVSGKQVTAYDAASGAQLWSQESPDASPATLGQGRALWVANNLLIAADLQSGAVAWKQPIAVEALVKAAQFSRVAPAVSGDKVCAGLAWEFNVLDLANGARGTHEDATGGGVSASLAADHALCYFPQSRMSEGGFGAGANSVTAVDPRSGKWSAKWSVDLGDSKADVGVANVSIVNDVVYAVTNHRVAAIEGGKLKWMVRGAPVTFHRVQASQNRAFQFDSSRGTVTNEMPGAGFAVGDGKIFLFARLEDKLRPRDVVTALEAATGAYAGSWEIDHVRDLAVVGQTLYVATLDGLRSVALTARVDRP